MIIIFINMRAFSRENLQIIHSKKVLNIISFGQKYNFSFINVFNSLLFGTSHRLYNLSTNEHVIFSGITSVVYKWKNSSYITDKKFSLIYFCS